MGLQGCWVTVIHGVGEVVVAEEAEAVVVEEIRGRVAVGKIRGGWFLSTLDLNFFMFRAWNPPLFIGGGRATLFLMVPNLDPWFSLEGSQPLTQSGYNELSNIWRLLELAYLGRHHSRCGVNRPKRIILGCSQMSGDHFRVSFIKFGGEMKH